MKFELIFMRLVKGIGNFWNIFEIDSYLSSVVFGIVLIFKVMLTSKNVEFQTLKLCI